MDIPRNIAGRKRRNQILAILAVLTGGVLVTVGLGRLKPAAPTVDRATVWLDTVKRGSMLRQVRGLGTLVPEDVLFIPALTEGRIERRMVLPGTVVKADTVLFEMRNPDLELSAVDAEWAFKAAEADLKSLKARLESGLLDQQSLAATGRGRTIGNISGVSAVTRRPVLRPVPTFSRSPPDTVSIGLPTGRRLRLR
jgi:HlyD family secretion protein